MIRNFSNELLEQRKKETEGNRSYLGRNEITEIISDLRGIITRFKRCGDFVTHIYYLYE